MLKSIALSDSPRKKRKFSAEKKYQIIEEVKSNPVKKGEILRREGLYRSDLIRFENIAREGAIKALSRSIAGKRKVYEISMEEYERIKIELEQKEKALADLSVEFMILKKKVNWV
jgi:transposase-like protein